MSKFFDKDTATKAFELRKDELEGRVLDETGRKGFHIIILDPSAQYRPHEPRLNQTDILFEYSFNKTEWNGSHYDAIARGKALLSLREKMNSGDVPAHLFRFGDVRYPGGVHDNGLTGAISGFDPKVDEAETQKILDEGAEIANAKFEKWKEIHAKKAFV